MSDQTPATPVETAIVEPVVEPQIPETAVVVPEPVEKAAEEDDSEFTATDLAYWKKFSRDNENAKNKALVTVKTLQEENSVLKSKLSAIEHVSDVTSVLSEFGLTEAFRPLLTETNLDALKAQALTVATAIGGKVPAPADTPVVVPEPQKFLNPLAGLSDVKSPKAQTFDERIRARINL